MKSKIWTYQHRVKFIFGAGALDTLPGETEPVSAQKPIIVCGRSAMRKTGILDRVAGLLGNEPVVFDQITPESNLRGCR